MEQLVGKMNQRQTNYVVTIQKLEDKYRQIEVEANGHFTNFVTDIKTKYKVKIDTFRTLMAVHKKELEKKQLEWEGGMKTLKNKYLLSINNKETRISLLYNERTAG